MVFAVRKAVFPPASPPGEGVGGLLEASGGLGVLRGLLTEFMSGGEGETFFEAGFWGRGLRGLGFWGLDFEGLGLEGGDLGIGLGMVFFRGFLKLSLFTGDFRDGPGVEGPESRKVRRMLFFSGEGLPELLSPGNPFQRKRARWRARERTRLRMRRRFMLTVPVVFP